MMRRGSFHPMAEQELNDAASYYNSQSPGLGHAFLDEVQRAVEQILEHPEAAPLVNRLVRRTLVPRFPYSVIDRPET
jgi:toxin ParE1/3/4